MSALLAGLLAPMVDATAILSLTRYALNGAEVDVAMLPPASREDPFFHADPLLHHLHRDLYIRFHAGIDPCNPQRAPSVCSGGGFIDALKAAHAGSVGWDDGWKVLDTMANGTVVAEKGHRIRRWVPGQYRFDGVPDRPRRDSLVSGLVLNHSTVLQAGYFYAFGCWLGDESEDLTGLRIYFNVEAANAPPLLGLVTGELDRRRLPFRFKCPSDLLGYARIDTAVLYVAARHGPIVLSVLSGLLAALAPLLSAPTPQLTLRLADGLALAEEPADGNSFGSSRALALAEGLKSAYSAGIDSVDGRMSAVLEAFSRRGYSLEHPHLMASANDPHGLRHLDFHADIPTEFS